MARLGGKLIKAAAEGPHLFPSALQYLARIFHNRLVNAFDVAKRQWPKRQIKLEPAPFSTGEVGSYLLVLGLTQPQQHAPQLQHSRLIRCNWLERPPDRRDQRVDVPETADPSGKLSCHAVKSLQGM